MPRVSHTQYELIFSDEEQDPQYFESKAEAIREARKHRADGREVELIASTSTWRDQAAVGHLAPIDTTDRPIRFAELDLKPTAVMAAHGVRLPSRRGRLNIDAAMAALQQMGYHLQFNTVRYDSSHQPIWKVTQPNGSVVEMSGQQITDLVYQKGKHMKSGKKTGFGQVSEMLSMIESQAADQRDIAKSNFRKLAAKIADIDHTREEWDRYVRVAKSLGYSESQIAGFSRAGAKAKFEDTRQILKAIQANMFKAERDLALLREKMKQGNWIACSAYCRTLAQIFAGGGGALESLFDEYMAQGGRVIPVRNSKDGSKAKFEKSDEYAAVLMKPVTVANCGKMMKVAAEAMKYAKSVGDDDLFELAEEVGHECRATKSRASRKDAR